MKRPLGVSVSAVCVLLGSLLMLGFLVLLSLVLLLSPGRPPLPPDAKLGMILGLLVFGLLGTWGTTTAIGLFRLRNWGRVSIIVFAALLAFAGLVTTPSILFIPPPPTTPPNYDVVRNIVAIFYAALGVLGAFWVYYFSRSATREAFGGTTVVEGVGRPLSISIIGWWLLVGGALCLLLSPLRIPASVFIWIMTGWTSAAWYAAFGALNTYAGYGLLRLNPTARIIAIAAFCFGAINSLVFFFFPGSDARMASLMSRFHFGSQTPPPTHFPIFMLAPMLLAIAVPLWFLICEKQAFHRLDLRTSP